MKKRKKEPNASGTALVGVFDVVLGNQPDADLARAGSPGRGVLLGLADFGVRYGRF
ncbi:hypothetical protein [Thiolapillus sp.]|uniref:hypothetical protein n=1 Tax=Thiolapillus sp. TaxID=2017437 RepID=UPI0025E38B4B|nr:hypothetical protein [Thiolapillus sp.]